MIETFSTPSLGRRRPLAIACGALAALIGCTAVAATRTVGSCADDGGSTTLRSVVANANAGDTLDMSALTCSTITLVSGAIEFDVGDLAIVGPGQRLTIDAGGHDRVFDDVVHYRHALRVANVTLANGYGTGVNAYGGCVESAYGDVTLDNVAMQSCAVRAIGGMGSFSGYAHGGAVSAGYTITANDATFTSNTATSTADSSFYASLATGGALYAETIAISGSTLSGNSAHVTGEAKANGGAIYGGVITLTQSTVTGNHAIAGRPSYYAYGGGVAGRQVTLIRSTVDNNVADGGSGGVAATTFQCYDSTVSGNRAAQGTGGAARLVVFDGAACTIAFNSASAGGGGLYMIRNSSGSGWNVQSTIIAQNQVDAGATFAADLGIGTGDHPTILASNDLIMFADSAAMLPANTIHSNPQLLPLAYNGGPTRTHALPAASPAVDTGNNAANFATDQRGQPRVHGAAADIGAFELQPDRIFANGFELGMN